MKTAARFFQGLDCMRSQYQRGWSSGYRWGIGTVFVMWILLQLFMRAGL